MPIEDTSGRIFSASAHITINASSAKVWDALTNPMIIEKSLFGAKAVSEWRVGSSITYSGIWNDESHEDKSKVIRVIENRLLQTTYWSSLSNKPDTPENNNNVTYTLEEQDGRTRLTVVQDNNPTKESADHSTKNWKTVLESMKEILEKQE